MLLETEGVTKQFGGLTAINQLDMHINEGEIVGLIGPNGAGKTTVFNLITGVLKPTRGKIIYDGVDITSLKSHKIVELEEKKSQVGAEIVSIDDKLETLRAKKERLGLAFADGAVQKNIYKSKLNQLKKQEANLLKCRHNVDPSELTELSELENRITMVKDVLSEGMLSLTEFGIFGSIGDDYIPIGFNAMTRRQSWLLQGVCPGETSLGQRVRNT